MRGTPIISQPYITAKTAWVGLFVYVVVIDLYLAHKDDSMSKQYLAWPLAATIPLTAYIVCHLHQKPRYITKYDPLNRLAGRIRGKVLI